MVSDDSHVGSPLSVRLWTGDRSGLVRGQVAEGGVGRTAAGSSGGVDEEWGKRLVGLGVGGS